MSYRVLSYVLLVHFFTIFVYFSTLGRTKKAKPQMSHFTRPLQCASLTPQPVERRTLTREARVRLPAVAVGIVVLSKPLMHSCFGLLSQWIMNEYLVPCTLCLVSVEGSALIAVKPWSSFQCTGIHHAVRARTYKGDEHLAYALIKSTAPLPFFIVFVC